ncbi:hypothetical protein [Tumebacillus flagellatus]|uniref:Uncharacterized protein n=1 Tax=Tumebacillus flagellatus TaxID=1157490 RepID=A0A074LRS8_9BACL|nr:hypothetical protein [Tumebacillus flagellatus]KEO84856.1 hypothetical protein EL26_02275 [Tumebacillus flagellatus]
MKTRTRTLFAGFALALMMSGVSIPHPVSAAIASNVPPDVQTYAEHEGLQEAKRLLEITGEDVQALTVGPGLQVYLPDVEKTKQSRDGSLLDVLKPIEQWEFVLEANGEPKVLLDVQKQDGQLSLVLTGGSGSTFMEAWESYDQHATTPPVLLHDMSARYFVGRQTSAQIAVPDSDFQVHPATELLRSLQERMSNPAQTKDGLLQLSGGGSAGGGTANSHNLGNNLNRNTSPTPPRIPVTTLLGIVFLGVILSIFGFGLVFFFTSQKKRPLP